MGRGAFQQKVVVITGGCAGIGRALALRFAQAGAHLAILDVQDESLVAFRQQLHDKLNADVLAINCDVSDDQACAEAMAQVVERSIMPASPTAAPLPIPTCRCSSGSWR